MPSGGQTDVTRRALAKNQLEFLKMLAKGHSPTKACEASGIGYSTVYRLKKEYPEFDEAWREASEQGIDRLEDEARRRAVDGCPRPVYQGGVQVGEIREYSDSLMSLLLKGRRKHVFSERVEQTGVDGGPVKHEMEITFVKAKQE